MDERAQERSPDILATLELVTNEMAVAVTRCSADFRYLWANQAYADWLRRPLREIVGRSILNVLGKEAFEALLPHFKRVLSGEKVQYEQETNVQGIGSRWISATYAPTLDSEGAANGWVAAVLDVTERKRAEEERFRHAAIVESYEDAIISQDLDAVIRSWNSGAERIFGYTEAEVIGLPITILIPSELREEEHKILEKLRAGGRVEHYETKRITKTGKRIDVSLTIGPIKDSTGRIVGFTKIAHDVTDRKQAEQAVKESESRFRLVADTAPVLIWMSGTDKLCTYFNKPWLDFTGRSIDSELGNGWVEGVHSDDLQRCLEVYTQAFDRREEFRMEYRLRRHDGKYRWVLEVGVPRFNQDHTFAGYIGSCIDITDSKLAQQNLSQANERLYLAMEAGRIGGWEWDIKSGRTLWFGHADELMGMATGEHARSIKEFWGRVHPEDRARIRGALESAERDNTDFNEEFRVVWPDGVVHWLRSQGKYFYAANGEPERMLGISFDITSQKQIENELRESELRLRLAAQAGKMYAYEWDVASDSVIRSGKVASVLGLPSEELRLTRQ